MGAGYDSAVRWWLPMWMVGCVPATPGHDCDLSQPHVVVATTDFSVGALAALTVDGCVADQLSTTTGDAVVRRTDEHVWVLERTGGDALRAYLPGDYGTPVHEVVVSRGGNAHDLVAVGDELLVALYDEAQVAVLDADGQRVGSIDLSAHADADGLPEVDTLVVTEAGVFASLQRLDRDEGWVSQGGSVVRLDVPGRVVAEVFEVGPNPRISAHDDGQRLVVATGHFFEADGEVGVLDPSTGSWEAWVDEDGVGLDVGWVVGSLASGTGFDVGADSVVGWVGPEGFAALEASPSWYAGGASGDGEVWVAVREGFGGSGDAGVVSVGDAGVVQRGSGFALSPFSIVWVGELSPGMEGR
jgi:hypothetical protein